MADLQEVQKAMERKRDERRRAEEERRQLVQKGSREGKIHTQLRLASKRASKVKTLDIGFVLDLTASMQNWLNLLTKKIQQIIDDCLQHMGQFARVRIAVVGYRDYADETPYVLHPLTSDVNEIKKFLEHLEAKGGGDECEDVLTGLEEALKLEWSSTARVLYLLSQTPHHGWRFQQDFQVCSNLETIQALAAGVDDPAEAEKWLSSEFYDLRVEDPRQWGPMDAALQELQKKDVQMIVLRLGESSDKMIEVFKQQYRGNTPNSLKLKVFDAEEDAAKLRCIVSSSSVASYGSSVLKLGQTMAIHGKRFDFAMDEAPPSWSSVGQWRTADAELCTYFMEDLDEPMKKTCRPFRALIAPMPFDKGAMRFAFYVVDEENPDRKYVGKVYQFDDPVFQQRSTYEGDMGSQAVASYLAKEFSVRYPESPIEFVQAHLLDLGDARDVFPFRFMALEPWITGKYEKFTSNAGHIAKDSDLAQAYSHFTWEWTGGEIMVVDIQGVGNTLTDPQIHSLDDRFGRGNLQHKGHDFFFMNHVCNPICKTLKLQAHPLQPGCGPVEADSEAAPQYYHIGSIAEEEEHHASGAREMQDVMPMPGSKLSAFLDAVRRDAEDALHGAVSRTPPSPSSPCTCLGGAVLQWKDGPEIVEVKKGSPAEQAGCRDGVKLKLVGGHVVQAMPQQEVLRLLAADHNMIVGMASNEKIQAMLANRMAAWEALQLLKSLLESALEARSSGGAGKLEELEDLLKKLENCCEKDDQWQLFLQALQVEALQRLESPEAADGWDEHLAVACDTLAGATFAWTSPPQVTAVLPGSLADGMVFEGYEFHEIDGVEIKSLAREEILHKLQECSRIHLRGRGQPQEKPIGFDGQTGLETGPFGPVTVTWSDPPMVLGRESRPQVLLSIDSKKVFGMTKQKLEEMIEGSPNCKFECYSLSELDQIELVPSLAQDMEDRFKRDQMAIHPGYQCSGCHQEPLVGARFSCKICRDHFCGACFKGRAHSHSPQHAFTVQDFPRTTATDAPVASKITEGSTVVVIGTGKKQLDGQPGLVKCAAPISSGAVPLWSVLMDGSYEDVNLEAKHLFLLEASPASEETLQPPVEPCVEAAPELKAQVKESLPAPVVPAISKPLRPEISQQKKGSEPRFTMVRQSSLRDLRQVEGQEALERLKAQGPMTAPKTAFLCKGNCGTMVKKDNLEYIKEGQLVMCEVCTQKSAESEKETTCRKCQQEFVYSQFLVDVGSYGLPNVCEECQNLEKKWAIISPLPK